MKAIIKTLSASDTAYWLRHKLGLSYDWRSRLADWRRGRALDYGGPVLLPASRSAYSPLYELSEIAAFIKDYRTFDRNAEAEVKPEIIYVELDIRTGEQKRLAHPPRPLIATTTATAGAAHV